MCDRLVGSNEKVASWIIDIASCISIPGKTGLLTKCRLHYSLRRWDIHQIAWSVSPTPPSKELVAPDGKAKLRYDLILPEQSLPFLLVSLATAFWTLWENNIVIVGGGRLSVNGYRPSLAMFRESTLSSATGRSPLLAAEHSAAQ